MSFRLIYHIPINPITIAITKPSNPIKLSPRAETFATVVNSVFEGFFKSFQTLKHWAVNDFRLNIFDLFYGKIKSLRTT